MLSKIRGYLYKAAVLMGLAIIILLLMFRNFCSCGTNPWGFDLEDHPLIGQVFDNDV